jgi:hypothetical protein
MFRPSGSLPTPWQPVTLSDLGRLPDCQTAKALPARVRAYTRVHMRAHSRGCAGRLRELAVWQSAQLRTLLILAACLAACLTLALCPGQRPTGRCSC